MQSFPWREVMRFGIVTLQISPREFWGCTLRELIPLAGNGGFQRPELNTLMKEFPD
jgi:uncharacterized phage protein (TIGR02216 family)